jgi:hypothetical protein
MQEGISATDSLGEDLTDARRKFGNGFAWRGFNGGQEAGRRKQEEK